MTVDSTGPDQTDESKRKGKERERARLNKGCYRGSRGSDTARWGHQPVNRLAQYMKLRISLSFFFPSRRSPLFWRKRKGNREKKERKRKKWKKTRKKIWGRGRRGRGRRRRGRRGRERRRERRWSRTIQEQNNHGGIWATYSYIISGLERNIFEKKSGMKG